MKAELPVCASTAPYRPGRGQILFKTKYIQPSLQEDVWEAVTIDKYIPYLHSLVMASKNSQKIYSEDTYYHIYNRGVEKRLIFLDQQDYYVFQSYLKDYLLPKDENNLRSKLSDPNISYKEKDKLLKLLRLNNFFGEIILTAYCLMPNHIHFLLKQKSANSIDKFMNSIGVRYAMYFNRKYQRVGSLFQDVYKAVDISSDEQLLYLTSYIHRNPLKRKLRPEENIFQTLTSQPSSYPEYLGQRKTEWLHPEEILTSFSKTKSSLSYQSFIEQNDENSITEQIIDLSVDFDQ